MLFEIFVSSDFFYHSDLLLETFVQASTYFRMGEHVAQLFFCMVTVFIFNEPVRFGRIAV